jgi:hypothetical protein
MAAGWELGGRRLDSPHAICRGYDIRRRFACVQLAKLQLESPVRLLASQHDIENPLAKASQLEREAGFLFLLPTSY